MTRYALVTAGGQGLGGAITRHLEASGYEVFAHYRTSVPKNGTGLRADLSAAAGRIDLMDQICTRTERLDVLVNNLGVYPEARLPDIPLGIFESVLALTLTTNFHLTQLALERGLLREGGRVVNIGDSSADRIEARTLATPYHVAKLGVHVLTRSYAEVLTPRGITVNMVSPGFLENSVGVPGRIPAGRKGRFEDVLGAVDYLLSPEAAYVSGANILVSGGWNL